MQIKLVLNLLSMALVGFLSFYTPRKASPTKLTLYKPLYDISTSLIKVIKVPYLIPRNQTVVSKITAPVKNPSGESGLNKYFKL